MIMHNETNDIVMNGTTETKEFTIKASAKAFKILSDGLYSNKIGAVVRELSTNAYDAHVEAGIPDKPFLIIIPNPLNPTFKIRDYGVGLSEENIYKIYTTFFESTKTNSNDAIGCLGLGSKAGFSIADNFSITSFFNGKKTNYVAFLDENGVPSITKMGTFDTDESNGLEISIGVKKNDLIYFKNEVKNQLKYFKTKPIIEGDSTFQWDKENDIVIDGDGWRITKNTSYNKKVIAIQGQIAYPLEQDMLKIDEYDDYTANLLYSLLHCDLEIEFNLGDLNINPSRESLSYDDYTINNINNKLLFILKDIIDKSSDLFDNVDTLWDAKKILNDLKNQIQPRLLEYMIEKNNYTINGESVTLEPFKIPDGLLKEKVNYHKKYSHQKWKKYYMYPSYDSDRKPNFHVQVFNQDDKTAIVYINEDEKGIEARAKQYCDDNSITEFIVLKAKKEISYDVLKKLLGDGPLIDGSTLPKVKRKKTTTGIKTSQNTIVVNVYNTSSWTLTEAWERKLEIQDFSEIKEHIYVDLDRVHAVDNNGKRIDGFNTTIKWMKLNGLIDDNTKIIGLRKSAKIKFKGELIYIGDYIKKLIKDKKLKIFNQNIKTEYRNFLNMLVQENEIRREIERAIKSNKKYKDIKEAISIIEYFVDRNYNKDVINALNQLLGNNLEPISEKFKLFLKDFPLLRNATYRLRSGEATEYINEKIELLKYREECKK